MAITFGICTYNRKNILNQMSKSLNDIEHLEDVNIRIYDDNSSEYDIEFLKNLFPYAKAIYRNETNLGADKNTAKMYKDFLENSSSGDYLFTADSDLIFNKNIISIISYLLPMTDGFLSLFNTESHETLYEYSEFLIEKKDVGAAGCCMTREIVSLILNETKVKNINFDYNYCETLRKNNIKILVTKKSIVQHIGYNGYNSNFMNFDYGKNFHCDSLVNANIIENLFEEYNSNLYKFTKSKKWLLFKITFDIFKTLKNRIKWYKRKKQ